MDGQLQRAQRSPCRTPLLLLLLLLACLGLPAAATGAFQAPAEPSSARSRSSIGRRLGAAAGSDSGASAVRERLLDGEREGALVVSTGRFPLIGMPAWSPPLHVGVLLSVEEKGRGRGRAGGGADGRGGYFLFDFVPQDPTAPATAMTLFRGGRVPGLVREKLLVAAAPKQAVRKGRCWRSLIEIRAFCQDYDAQLSLVGNNCQTFADALLDFVLDGQVEEEEELGRKDGQEDDEDEDVDDAASVLDWILGDDD